MVRENKAGVEELKTERFSKTLSTGQLLLLLLVLLIN